MTKQIYYAAPLFSRADQFYNEHLASLLREAFPAEAFYVPQEQTDINDKSLYADSQQIADYDVRELLKSKLVVASLDGGQVDPGVAAEIGIAYHAGIPVVALYSDVRQEGADNQEKIKALQEKVAESQFSYVNLFVVGIVKLNGTVVSTEQALISAIREKLQ